jgi:hypothetical protein
MIRDEHLTLSSEDQTLLAAWASKCGYAYAARWEPQKRPWSEAEYRDLAQRLEPSPRALIWMGHSTAPQAYIAEAVDPLFMAPSDTPAAQVIGLPPAGVGLYLAAHSVVFIGHWLLADLLTEWEDIFSDQIRNGLSRIWPPSDEILWPTPDIPEERLLLQHDFIAKLAEAEGLPITGHTAAEIEPIKAAYVASLRTV